ncbi:contractile injection system protein, VgrG/Pvc8 family [Vibrio gazogenes]|uniref:Type IV secretion protein Rhs n=1 Tax=Vibrio gazogenes TaxID=687 RepID=A0A1Z2SJG3_VIBGA|nr:contractile injection system protein, VgrG/Pvc8 family [Vibrio gazogenes]ASA57324.1 hypothetical protein BSQ33_16185 [Vibrio gazogenes]
MSENDLPLDYMALQGGRQFNTSLSFSVDVGHDAKTLNANYLRLVSLQGQEQVSEPYQFTLVLRGNALTDVGKPNQGTHSDFGDIPESDKSGKPLPHIQGVAASLLGQWAQAKLGYTSDFASNETPPGYTQYGANQPLASRYFNGIVSSVSLSAPGEYTVALASPLFPLTLRNKYHVFKGLSIQGVIGELLKPELSRYGQRFHVDYRITGLSASRVQDWLQAGETDFAMLQRLMKKAAIHFYFIHADAGLTLVFSNQPSRAQDVTIPGAVDGQVSLRYSYTDSQGLGLQQADLFCNLSYQTQLTTQGVQSVLTHQQANWETNAVAEYTSYPVVDDTDHSDFHFYKTFAYGVNKDESEESLAYIDQQLACQQTTLTGDATCYFLSPGYAFTLSQQAIHPSNASTLNPSGSLIGKGLEGKDQRYTADNLMPAQFDGAVFVVTKITHKASEHSPYTGSVEATPLPTGTQDVSTEVLITPFTIQDTHQGSVLATVIESAVPKSSYFLEKSDFSTELSATQFGLNQSGSSIERNKQIGCVVQFATDVDTDITHWIALSDGSQTAPAVGSMVMIGRGDNESEIPQIQQVLSSHGQKTIQPRLWRNNSWTFNTNWGSSCNTSYGDSLNIHFGSEATPDLKTAMTVVQTAYGNPTVLGAKFGGASYDQGCSFSYSTTSNGAKGLANASVSQGSHFSESHSEQDYSVSYNNCRQSYSQSNKSVNISYQGPFTDSVDENNLSFINGRVPNQRIIDICNGLPDGSSYNESHVVGTSTSISTFEGIKSDTSTVLGDCTSVSTFGGIKSDTSTVTGACNSNSTFMGIKADISVVSGLCTTMNTMLAGNITSNVTTGDSTTTNTITGAQTTTNTISGTQITNDTISGDTTHNTKYEGLVTVSEDTAGVYTHNKTRGGVKVDNEEASAGTKSIEYTLSLSLVTVNITVDAVLSIM